MKIELLRRKVTTQILIEENIISINGVEHILIIHQSTIDGVEYWFDGEQVYLNSIIADSITLKQLLLEL